MMEKGQLDPYKLLPLLAEALGRKADATQEQREGSIDFAQGKARFSFESLLMKFGAGGGNDAFRNFWNEASIAIPKLEGLFTMLAGAATGLVRALAFISEGFSDISNAKFTVESSFTAIGAAALVLGTTLGRAFLPLTAAMALLEDMAMYKSGQGRSLLGYVLGEEGAALENARMSQVPENLRKRNLNPAVLTHDIASKMSFSERLAYDWNNPVASIKGLWSAATGDESYYGGAVKYISPSLSNPVGSWSRQYSAEEGVNLMNQVTGGAVSPMNPKTVVNITIDGVTKRIEQEMNNAGVIAIQM